MKSITGIGLITIMSLGAIIGAQAAGSVDGKWKRPDGSIALVSPCGGKLCGHLISGSQTGYEMFNGMSKTGANKWEGNKMKNPSAPGFMSFNGTALLVGDKLDVQGCAIGHAMCGHETWTRVK